VAIHPTLPDNIVRQEEHVAEGTEAALAGAPHRLSFHVHNQRLAAVPMEPTACLADWPASGPLTLYATLQTPHNIRNYIASKFGLSHQQVRVVAPDVGGGFGPRNSFYPEYLLTSELSRRLRRPVKYVETRSENITSMVHGRDQTGNVEVGFDDEGHLLALRVQIDQNCGVWPDNRGVSLPRVTSFLSGGCYRIPKIAASYRVVATNTTPVGAYRGAGKPEAAFMIERAIDRIAVELALDPVDVRRRNLIRPEETPYQTQFEGIVYDEGDYPAALEKVIGKIDYEALREEQAARRSDPTAALLGIGFGMFIELSGVGPTPMMEKLDYVGGWESANVRLNSDGSVVAAVGTSPHGQGHETVFSQIIADVLSVPIDRISVIHGDTAVVQEGTGTAGGRSLAVGGPAVQAAAVRVREKAKQIAAHTLEADEADIEYVDGQFHVRGAPGRGVSLAEVARTSYRPHKLPGNFNLGLDETVVYEPTGLCFTSGAHCCIAEIDRDTGKVRILRYVAVDDCGTVINPLIVMGQVHGGLAQGIAQALIEEIRYGDDGQPATATMIDYTLPSALDLPTYEAHHIETPTSVNPLGAKGVGESGAIGAPHTVVNAVVDALSHLGVRDIDMPCTPQKVWRILNDATVNGALSAP
jgi:carbon-monoxide dehydrogenase large subunit